MTNHNERRAPNDRRSEDSGPPSGWKDRRRRTERRIPEIREQTMTEAEWQQYFGGGSPVKPEQAPMVDAAASVFDKVRD